jgi:hypothetical protein
MVILMERIARHAINLNLKISVSKQPARGCGPEPTYSSGFVTETGGSDVLFRFTIQCDIATTLPLLIVVVQMDAATSATGRPGHHQGDAGGLDVIQIQMHN